MDVMLLIIFPAYIMEFFLILRLEFFVWKEQTIDWPQPFPFLSQFYLSPMIAPGPKFLKIQNFPLFLFRENNINQNLCLKYFFFVLEGS
jgi:hypothetical protein